MIVISINNRGLGVIRVDKPSLIIFQETMVCREKVWEAMLSMCPAWQVVITDGIGLSGGLGVMWDPKIIKMHAFLSCVGIIMIGNMMGNWRVQILNSNAPYVGHRLFWDHVAQFGILRLSPIIIMGIVIF